MSGRCALYASATRRVRQPARSSTKPTNEFPTTRISPCFKAAGYQGVNFANIGGVVHYHTPLDNFENADTSTLQHHG